MKREEVLRRPNVLGQVGHFLNYTTSLGGKASVTATRFLRFGTSSSFTLMIDILLLAFFVEVLGIFYLIAAGMSFAISTSINYFINRGWGFKGTVTGLLKGYFLFLFISIFGIALTVFLMWVFVDLIGLFYLIARVVVAIIEGTMTFVANYKFTFEMPKSLNLKDEYFKN